MPEPMDFAPYPRPSTANREVVLLVLSSAWGEGADAMVSGVMSEADALGVISAIVNRRPQRAVTVHADDRIIEVSEREVVLVGREGIGNTRINRVVIGTDRGKVRR